MKNKKYIVFIGSLSKRTAGLIRIYKKKHKKKWEVLVLRNPDTKDHRYGVTLDFSNVEAIKSFFKNYGDQIFSITAQTENSMSLFQKIIPYVPEHIHTPSVRSLQLCTEKTEMRKAFRNFDKSITPKFFIFKEYNTDKIERVVRSLQFPVIVKPSGLNASMLVQAAYYKEELDEILKKSFPLLQKVHKEKKGRGNPMILVEELIDGNVYSTDVHINSTGEAYFNPFVAYKIAHQKGFEDFFVYDVSLPSDLPEALITEAQKVAKKGIDALGLRSSTAHIELIYKNNEWKIIEIGARVGGNRSVLYKKTLNINIDINDILVRADKKPNLKAKYLGYSSMLKFYPKQEGFLKKLKGIKKIEKLPSISLININFKKGEKSLLAKNGGKYIVKVSIFNKNRLQLIADKRKLEKYIEIETVRSRKKLLSE